MINRTILNTALQKSYYANEANNKQILSSYSEQPIELKNESIPVPTLVAYMLNKYSPDNLEISFLIRFLLRI